ncbi:MAG: hypothetical protein U0667_17100 [Chloroflexota bacterium]
MRQAGGPVERRSDHDRHEQQRAQQLEQEQQRAPQPLPWRVGLDVADQALPQERGRHLALRSTELEHPEGDDDREREQAQEPQRRQQ